MVTKRGSEIVTILAITAFLAFSAKLIDLPLCLTAFFAISPCPTCGTTGSIFFILHGQLLEAWERNPIGFLVVLILIRRMIVLSLKDHPLVQQLNCNRIDFLLFAIYLSTFFYKSAELISKYFK